MGHGRGHLWKRALTCKNRQCFQPDFIGAALVDLQQRQHCPNTQLVTTPLLPCWGSTNFGMFHGSKPKKRFHVSLLWIISANFQSQRPSRKIWMSPRQKAHSLVTRGQMSYIAPIYQCCAFFKELNNASQEFQVPSFMSKEI